MTLARRLIAAGHGPALPLAVVVGSGILAERLAGGNVAIALLANTIATGAGLVALILMFGTISGAHFNPAVTISEAWQKKFRPARYCLTSPCRSRAHSLAWLQRTACSERHCFSPPSTCVPDRRNGGASSLRPLA